MIKILRVNKLVMKENYYNTKKNLTQYENRLKNQRQQRKIPRGITILELEMPLFLGWMPLKTNIGL